MGYYIRKFFEAFFGLAAFAFAIWAGFKAVDLVKALFWNPSENLIRTAFGATFIAIMYTLAWIISRVFKDQ